MKRIIFGALSPEDRRVLEQQRVRIKGELEQLHILKRELVKKLLDVERQLDNHDDV